MTELTPARLREAAEVVDMLDTLRFPEIDCASGSYSARDLEQWAQKLEADQAAEASRDKRIKELADEMVNLFYRGSGAAKATQGDSWWLIATGLLDRYPALLSERPADE